MPQQKFKKMRFYQFCTLTFLFVCDPPKPLLMLIIFVSHELIANKSRVGQLEDSLKMLVEKIMNTMEDSCQQSLSMKLSVCE